MPSNSKDICGLPQVDIDPAGVFKYIQIEVYDSSSDSKHQTLIRGYATCDYHADILDRVTPFLEKKGLSVSCPGGGRIERKHNSIRVYGYSQVDGELQDKLKKFRFRKEKTNAALVIKIEKASMSLVLEEEFDEVDVDELASELTSVQPRYVVFSVERRHDDGRISYPLCLVFVTPQGCAPDLQIMYAGSLNNLASVSGVGKVFEVRSTDELTEEWLTEKLQSIR